MCRSISVRISVSVGIHVDSSGDVEGVVSRLDASGMACTRWQTFRCRMDEREGAVDMCTCICHQNDRLCGHSIFPGTSKGQQQRRSKLRAQSNVVACISPGGNAIILCGGGRLIVHGDESD
eukprot:GHVO01028879.1.p1 GENE.GHVO01028879.1~~GHVO01028879.1.p1  ORF type:complete len:121 (-),score=21.02 GHVO01028879.1:168-530(-)